MSHILEVNAVSKYFRAGSTTVKALEDVTFKRDKGCTVLLGLNGSGKTTLINLILGVLVPDKGYILVEGNDPAKKPGLPAFPLFPWYDPRMSVSDLILSIEMFFDIHVPEKYIRLFGLEELMDRQLQKLSEGYLMRLRLLSAVVQPTRLILLDEITNGLDVDSVNTFVDIINKIKSERGIIFATHIFEHAEAVADSVLVLHKGRLLFDGSRNEFLKLARPLLLLRGKNISVGRKSGDYYVVEVDEPEKELPKIVLEVKSWGGLVEEIDLVRPGFKSAFLEVVRGEGS